MPKTERKDKSLRKRFFWQSVAINAIISWSFICYAIIQIAFVYIPEDIQWTLTLILPIIRELNIRLLQKAVAFRGPGKRDFDHAKLPSSHFMETRHAVYISILVGTMATPTTTYMVLGGDFLMNIYYGVRIIYLLKKSTRENASEEGESTKDFLEKQWP